MTTHTNSKRATVDVINFWCVAVLVISAASVAGVVGAAVVTGEFEDRNFNTDAETTAASVLTETQPDGSTRVRWADEGEARSLRIMVDDEEVETLNFVGDEATIQSGSFEVIAVNADGSQEVIESRG